MQISNIQVAVIAREEASFPGSVRELTRHGALAQFQAATCPQVNDGSSVQLVFSSPSCTRVLPVDAQLATAQDVLPMRLCTFSFLKEAPELEDLLRSASPNERRRARRIIPQAHQVALRLMVPRDVVPMLPGIPDGAEELPEGVAVPASVVDLSHGGVAARIDLLAELAFVASDRVLVEMAIEALGQTIVVEGKILHRQEHFDGFCYGIEFQWKATEDAAAKQRALTIAMIRWRHRAPTA